MTSNAKILFLNRYYEYIEIQNYFRAVADDQTIF